MMLWILVCLSSYDTSGQPANSDVLVLTNKKHSDKIEILKPGDNVVCVIEDSSGQRERIKGIITVFDNRYINSITWSRCYSMYKWIF